MQTVNLVRAVGQKENNDFLIVPPYDPRHLEAIEFRHIYVKKNQVGTRFPIHFQSHITVVRIDYLITFRLDKAFQKHRVFNIIINQKDFYSFLHCGNIIVKHVPFPSVLSTVMSPPCASTSNLT